LSCKLTEPLKTMQHHLDIIGDIHGHWEHLLKLTEKMGYKQEDGGEFVHPDGRKLLFLGDLIDRGRGIADVLRSVRATVESGNGYCIMGNHEANFICYNRTDPEGVNYLREHS
jgi:protein phosphatase